MTVRHSRVGFRAVDSPQNRQFDALRFFLPPYAAAGIQTHERQKSCTDPGPLEGRSSNWATAPRQTRLDAR